ncbi:MAG: hypothetical protein BRC58_04435 [Cyanobacteria bacterium QS_8_64_29]|nr:MAG: hypothetical protein BRC58_04435 [Cyanobacteria bacterium QS_8_64_29]
MLGLTLIWLAAMLGATLVSLLLGLRMGYQALQEIDPPEGAPAQQAQRAGSEQSRDAFSIISESKIIKQTEAKMNRDGDSSG